MSSTESAMSWNVVCHGLVIAEIVILITVLFKLRSFNLSNQRLMQNIEEIDKRIASIQDWLIFSFMVSIAHSVSILSFKVDTASNGLIIAAAFPVLLSIATYLYSSNLQMLSDTVNSNLMSLVVLQTIIVIGLHIVFYVLIMPTTSSFQFAQSSQFQLSRQPNLFPKVGSVPSSFGENAQRFRVPGAFDFVTEMLGGEVDQHVSPGLSKQFKLISEQDFNSLTWDQKINELFQGRIFEEFRVQCEKLKKEFKQQSEEFKQTGKSSNKENIRRRIIMLGIRLDKILTLLREWIYRKETSETFTNFAVGVIVKLLEQVITDEIFEIQKSIFPKEEYVNLQQFINSSPSKLQVPIHNIYISNQSFLVDDNTWINASSTLYVILLLIMIINENRFYNFTTEQIINFEYEIQKYMRQNVSNRQGLPNRFEIFVDELTNTLNEQELIDIQYQNSTILESLYQLYTTQNTSYISQFFGGTKSSTAPGPKENVFYGAVQSIANKLKPKAKITN